MGLELHTQLPLCLVALSERSNIHQVKHRDVNHPPHHVEVNCAALFRLHTEKISTPAWRVGIRSSAQIGFQETLNYGLAK